MWCEGDEDDLDVLIELAFLDGDECDVVRLGVTSGEFFEVFQDGFENEIWGLVSDFFEGGKHALGAVFIEIWVVRFGDSIGVEQQAIPRI